jgi:hypothetical protein
VLAPVSVEARGLRFPGLERSLDDGHYGEPYWFDDTLAVALAADTGLVVRYTLDGRVPTAASPAYAAPLRLASTTHLRARAFTRSGEPVGYDRWMEYQLHPLHAEVTGELRTPLAGLWELLSDAAQFTGSVTIRLSSGRPGVIRYTLDASPPTAGASPYAPPITLTGAATVRARLFTPEGEPVGAEWAQRFERVDQQRRE